MLARVLQCLEAAEVDGRLHLGRVPANAVGSDLGGYGGSPGRGGQRVGQTLVRQQRWIDAVGQVTKFLKGVLQVATKLLHQGSSLVRRPVGKLPGQPHLHGEGNQMLLRTVVEIALDPPAFGVGRRHDAASRRLQSVCLPADFVERGLERRVQTDVVERQTHLTGQFGEDAVLLRRERLGIGRPVHDHQPQELSGMGDRDGADHRFLTTLQQVREPHLDPSGPGDSRSSHGGLLLGGQREPGRVVFWLRHGQLERAAGGGPHLCRAQAERPSQRLGHLEQQLVEWDGP